MDQQKTGTFLKELRKEKGLTQEQLAEQFNVSNRTISRWENGNTMPDLSNLVELADFCRVDVREIIDGERKSEMMDKDLKETLVKVTEYTDLKREEKKKKLNHDFMLGGLCLLIVICDRQFGNLSIIFKDYISDLVRGALCSLGLLFEFIGFYNNNHEVALKKR
ncbi:MAG: helix-turn-helix transcriptional regulator [Clostridia bacterium]|nr:helix-turn-helix transcriptional regulator [Clostridia bacterium]